MDEKLFSGVDQFLKKESKYPVRVYVIYDARSRFSARADKLYDDAWTCQESGTHQRGIKGALEELSQRLLGIRNSGDMTQLSISGERGYHWNNLLKSFPQTTIYFHPTKDRSGLELNFKIELDPLWPEKDNLRFLTMSGTCCEELLDNLRRIEVNPDVFSLALSGISLLGVRNALTQSFKRYGVKPREINLE